MRINIAIAITCLAVASGSVTAQTLETASFGRDGGELAYRNRAPNYTVNYVVPANTGVTFAVPASVAAGGPKVQDAGAADFWASNDFGVCYGTALQTCPASMAAATSTPSVTIISKGSKGVALMPINGSKIISITTYSAVSGTEFAVDLFKAKGQ